MNMSEMQRMQERQSVHCLIITQPHQHLLPSSCLAGHRQQRQTQKIQPETMRVARILLLSALLVSACAHRQMLQEDVTATEPAAAVAAATDVAPEAITTPQIEPIDAAAATATAEEDAAAATAIAAGVPDADSELRVPGPPRLDPAGMGKRNGYYR